MENADTRGETKQKTNKYGPLEDDFVKAVYAAFQETTSEIAERNQKIDERDEYIYGEKLERSIDIPVGHDFTLVNWLRRTVEIHKNMFMSRGFQLVSTYDSQDLSMAADQEDQKGKQIENKKFKQYAESRKQMVDAIIADNGGFALFGSLAESASAVGDAAVKAWYDSDQKKYVISPIESIENLYVLWSSDDFRQKQAVAYAYQVSPEKAISQYNVPKDVPTSSLGRPFTTIGYITPQKSYSGQKMVTVMDIAGKIPGWGVEDGKPARVMPGKEKEINATIVGNCLYRLVDEPKKMARYYLFPNKRQRKRAWSVSDVSDAAININLTYIETLSDWRTLASKVNFQKYKAFGFGMDTPLPKYEARRVQVLPMSDGQDIQRLDMGDANRLDFKEQMEELKEQFVRETGISRVLFDDPSVTLNSNQALLTSMKPTSDIAEAKKQLWTPILIDLFTDALETVAEWEADVKELVDPDSSWSLKVMWPSVMQKEDPIYQQMLLNRFNNGTMSLQSFLEAQGESKEELDRLRDELTDPVTAAVHGKQTPLMAQILLNAATADIQAWYQSLIAASQPQGEGVNPNGGTASPDLATTQANNQPGQGLMATPGSGAPVSPQGALNQTNQNIGG